MVHLPCRISIGDGAARRGSNVVIGCPNDGASDSLTDRGITDFRTLSPKCSRTSLTTCPDSFVRASYITHTMVLMSRVGFRLRLTRSTLRSSWPRPSSA